MTETFQNDLTEGDRFSDMTTQEKKSGVNLCYTFAFLVTVGLGQLNFGYAMSCFNSMASPYVYNWNCKENQMQDGMWNEDNFLWNKLGTIVTSCTILGQIIGSQVAGTLIKYGKWKMMFYFNAILIVGAGICQIENIWIVLIGRLIWGFGSGAFVVFVPKFVNETAPEEYKGSFGVMTQFMCCVGIVIPSFMGLKFPYGCPTNAKDYNAGINAAGGSQFYEYTCSTYLAENSFDFTEYWRYFFGLPIVFSLFQMLLLWLVFPYDSPQTLKQNKDHEKLTEVMMKIYHRKQVSQRIEMIVVEDQSSDNDSGPSYSETFCDPKIRRAAWIGCSISALQQLTGINAIIFYSSIILGNPPTAALNSSTIPAILNSVNLIGATTSSFILAYAGRKTMLVSMTLVCSLFLFLMAFSSYEQPRHDGSTWKLLITVFCCFYLIAFQWGPGPVTWMYMSEVMNNKGVQIGTLINLLLTLMFSLFTEEMFSASSYIPFIVFGVIQAVAGVVLIFVMKETKGLTNYQVQRLYRTDNDEGDYQNTLMKVKYADDD